jgi:hypothetical protein
VATFVLLACEETELEPRPLSEKCLSERVLSWRPLFYWPAKKQKREHNWSRDFCPKNVCLKGFCRGDLCSTGLRRNKKGNRTGVETLVLKTFVRKGFAVATFVLPAFARNTFVLILFRDKFAFEQNDGGPPKRRY